MGDGGGGGGGGGGVEGELTDFTLSCNVGCQGCWADRAVVVVLSTKETHPSVWDKYGGSQHSLCRVSEGRGVLLSLVTVWIAGKSWTDAGCALMLRVLRVDMSFVCRTIGVESWTDVGCALLSHVLRVDMSFVCCN